MKRPYCQNEHALLIRWIMAKEISGNIVRFARPLLLIIAILGPFGGIAVDVFPTLAVVVLAADHVLIVSSLPNVKVRIGLMDLFAAVHFQKADRL